MDPRISRNIFEHLPQIIILIKPDDLSVTYINRVTGKYKLEDLLNKPIMNHILPEFKDSYLALIKKVIHQKQSGEMDLSVPSSANPSNMEWFKNHLIPLLGADGELELVLSVSENITVQKFAERDVIIKQRNLEAIINNTDDIIISIDRNRKLIEFNEVFRKLLRQTHKSEVAKGEDVLLYIDPSKHERYKAIYERIFAGEKIIDIEEFSRKDLPSFFFEASFNPLYNHQNEIYGITIYTRNITERMLHDRKLKLALDEKEVLLSEIHHRIKNNLAVISSMLQIQAHCNKSPEISSLLETTTLRIKSAAIVHELLYEQKQFNSISVKTFLSALLEEIRKTFSSESLKILISGTDFNLSLDRAVPFALLMNELYTNAFKHSFPNGAHGTIETTTGISEKRCWISLSDDGIPFPADIGKETIETVGIILLHTFIKQLDGKMEFRPGQPKEIYLSFPFE